MIGDDDKMAWQRIMDICLSFVALVILSPIFLITAIAIKLEDRKSPVFFIQQRVGYQGDIFNIYKFRSMAPNAEQMKQSLMLCNKGDDKLFKVKNDPRVTKVGRFIRDTSIDELPQLFNVLKGEMSLVGPRPSLIEEVKHYDTIAYQRLNVKPGCTGVWQVNKHKRFSFDQMLQDDLFWIQNRSFLLYIKIILQTIVLMIKGASVSLFQKEWQ